jgi:hypothetical protein
MAYDKLSGQARQVVAHSNKEEHTEHTHGQAHAQAHTQVHARIPSGKSQASQNEPLNVSKVTYIKNYYFTENFFSLSLL